MFRTVLIFFAVLLLSAIFSVLYFAIEFNKTTKLPLSSNLNAVQRTPAAVLTPNPASLKGFKLRKGHKIPRQKTTVPKSGLSELVQNTVTPTFTPFSYEGVRIMNPRSQVNPLPRGRAGFITQWDSCH